MQYMVYFWIIPHCTLPGESKGEGDQAQIAPEQCISQGKRHGSTCCPFQGGTSPISIGIIRRAYTSSHPVLVHAGPACSCPVPYSRQPVGDRNNVEGRVDPPQRSLEFAGRLFDNGRSNPSLCNAFLWHVRWQAHRQAHDRWQSKNIAPIVAFSTSRPHRSRGMHWIYSL